LLIRPSHIAPFLIRCFSQNQHCGHRRRVCTGLMRHYLGNDLRLSPPPFLLTRGMLVRPSARALVTRSRPAHRRLPRLASTSVRAVKIAVITGAADAYLLATAPTLILPIGPLTHRAHRFTNHWTNSCSARITCRRILPIRHRTEGPGADRESIPGPSPQSALHVRIANIHQRHHAPCGAISASLIDTLGKKDPQSSTAVITNARPD